ncbi:TPA: helix-turn-helix transcriptional regulator [Mannheimia haemolytica]|nr:helix-turn-helix transcriptional regulator [Mannheimia haemolytica]HDL5235640.1 helix-turn-helix transcriptional regulator [Mannheimia haemolytica]HDL5365021.1 helix-turn-helix transcriptional regulator [Mannheimia haemolytica]HDZ3572426.1 helix-turn-helix transcriptional regulator [Mannheimia haemolytica]HDZ6829871.1 helix-turn-helix transcriptional regulator [Mannheimia haemolytica]
MSDLSSRLSDLLAQKNLSMNEFAKMVGVTQPAIAKIVNGETRSPKNIVEIADALDVDVNWLKTGKGEAPNFANFEEKSTASEDKESIRVSLLNAEAVAGYGVEASHVVEEVSAVEYTLDHFRQLFHSTNAQNIRLINVKGDSMYPTLESGDLIFVDVSINHYDGDGVYVFTFDGTLFVKRLQKVKYDLVASSDNPAYESWSLTKEEQKNVYIHGKVMLSQSQAVKRF